MGRSTALRTVPLYDTVLKFSSVPECRNTGGIMDIVREWMQAAHRGGSEEELFCIV